MKHKKIYIFCLVLLFSTIIRASSAIDLYNQGALVMEESKNQEIDNALKLFELSLEKDNAFLPARFAIVNALILKYESSSNKQDKMLLKKALSHVDIILNDRPGNAKAYYCRALIFFDLSQEKKAKRALKKALWSDPKDMDINIAYFYYLLSSKDYQQAYSFIKRAQKYFQNNVEVLLLFADGFVKHSCLNYLDNILSIVIKKYPEDDNFRLAVANLYKQGKNYQKAVENYEKALELGSKDKVILFNLGFCFAGIKNYERAIVVTKKFCEINPNHIGAKNNLAVYQESLGLFKDANKTWLEILNNKDSSKKHRERAMKRLNIND